jgi:hypothetical protein
MSHRRWHASWIWSRSDLAPKARVFMMDTLGTGEEHALLRRTFSLDALPARAEARIVADSRYILFVNGVESSRGPVRGELSKLRYDAVDLAPQLRLGENVIAIHARYYAEPTSWWTPVRPSIGLGRRGAVAFELGLGQGEWLGSDAEWRSWPGDAWTPLGRGRVGSVSKEQVDGRSLPAGWTRPGFDDGAWEPAVVINPLSIGGDVRVTEPPSNPYGALLPRPIPQLEGATRVPRVVRAWRVAAAPTGKPPPDAAFADEGRPEIGAIEVGEDLPVSLEGEGTLLLRLDFGEIVAGLPGIEVDAPPGVEIELATRETEAPPDPKVLDPTSDSTFRYTTRGHDDVFEGFDPMGFRFALLAIRGANAPVAVRRFQVRERLYPVRPGPEFRCSDPVLDRIYEVGKRTVAINAHDAYLDCPSREQRGWTGDAVVHQMVHLTTNTDWGLARWHPEMSNSPRPDGMLPMAAGSDLEAISVTIPEWPLHWIRSLWNLMRYTGDRDLVARLLPGAENVLRWFIPYRGDHGLVRHVDQWVLVDWAALHLADTSSTLNAQWARALLEFAEMSDWLGDAGRASFARRLHGEIRDAFELFWDEERGSYVDHAVDGEPRRPMSQHAGATAIWARLVPEERIDRILRTILDRSRLVRSTWAEIVGQQYLALGIGEPDWDVENEIVAAQPFYRFIVHDAVASAGRADLVPDLCRDWKGFLDRGETTWPELWEGGTHCHGWSSTPSRDLVMYTLGIQPAEPGFAVARVAPRLGDLDWAEGVAPSPHGPIRVRAERERVEIDSPVPVDLDLPGRATQRLEAGEHRVAVPDRAGASRSG